MRLFIAEKRIGLFLDPAEQRLDTRLHPAELSAPAMHGGLLGQAGIQILPGDHALDDRSPVVLVRHDEIR